MNLTQNDLTLLVGQKELDNYALRLQVQQLQQEIESLKSQIEQMENNNG